MSEEEKMINRFEVGGETLLDVGEGDGECGILDKDLENVRLRVGTLLKAENVSLLLGAGASVDCGGQLIGSVPLDIERILQEEAEKDNSHGQQWLSAFYLSARYCGAGNSPVKDDEIIKRREQLEDSNVSPLKANFEQVLARLYRWRSALPATGGRLRIDGEPALDATAKDLDEALRRATQALAGACKLPVAGKEEGLRTYEKLVRKLLTRPLNLKRVNIFTLNYDTLVEQAADAEGVVLLDGFVGTQRRVFRPESYEQDLYFPAETTEGRVHRFERVLHLYKLHGSITWKATEPSIDNPYGILSTSWDAHAKDSLLIYPTPAKYGETLGLPYSELFRRFAAALTRPQSVLFVIGYGFGDEHVNAIIRQALAVPSFTLVIVDPAPTSSFVKTLREQRDRRVWIAEGASIGTFAGFVQKLLPDLQDEEIRKKVLETHRALTNSSAPQGDQNDDK